jgi:hypothetical protein
MHNGVNGEESALVEGGISQQMLNILDYGKMLLVSFVLKIENNLIYEHRENRNTRREKHKSYIWITGTSCRKNRN